MAYEREISMDDVATPSHWLVGCHLLCLPAIRYMRCARYHEFYCRSYCAHVLSAMLSGS